MALAEAVLYNECRGGVDVDKAKMGMFISQCRRENQITQEQLAEALGVTCKAVSKWENGKCLPDAALYEPLCGLLGISINELFAAQRIPEKDYCRIADENLLRMLKLRLYQMSDRSIAFEDFSNALSRIAEVTAILQAFETKEAAVRFLSEETHISMEECSAAYDFYSNMFAEKEKTDL